MSRVANLLVGVMLVMTSAQAKTPEPVLKTARGHAIQYYLALPPDWAPGKQYPVLITLEGGGKLWLNNVLRFAHARDEKHYPFIVVAPLILTNGGKNLRALPTYTYSSSVWDDAERKGRCAFDVSGLQAIAADVEELYGGQKQYFLTGFSAGGHLAWTMIFQHPEMLAGAAVIEGNYTGRCITSEVVFPVPFSSAPERAVLPIEVVQGGADIPQIASQSADAVSLAGARGYKAVNRTTVPGAGHMLMPDRVLEFFNSLLKE